MIERVSGLVDPLGDEIIPDAEVLKDNDIILTPGSLPEDIELVMKFALGDRYNETPEPQLVKGLELVKYLWIGKVNESIGGVVMICFLDKLDWWTLDAYKNSEHDNRDGDYSFRAGRLVIDWFFTNMDADSLRTMHRTDNVLATKMCERLGFEKTHHNPEFVVLRLMRDKWASRH